MRVSAILAHWSDGENFVISVQAPDQCAPFPHHHGPFNDKFVVSHCRSLILPCYSPGPAAVYGARYVSDRYLPDKAIDLVDEAASALRLAQESKPDELEALDRDVVRMQIELESLKAETDVFTVERRGNIERDLREVKEKAEELTAIWQNGALHTPHGLDTRANTCACVERARLDRIKDIKLRLEEAKHELEVAQRHGSYERASQLRFSTIPDLERKLPKESEFPKDGEEIEGPLAMIHERVTSNDIARVVAKATGIPVQNLMKGVKQITLHMVVVILILSPGEGKIGSRKSH